jgi:hypothetical protein
MPERADDRRSEIMPAAGESIDKLEDMIVRAAESTAAHARAARDAVGTVIFGQEKVVEQALITILSGGHALWWVCRVSPKRNLWKPWVSCSGSMRAASSSRPI